MTDNFSSRAEAIRRRCAEHIADLSEPGFNPDDATDDSLIGTLRDAARLTAQVETLTKERDQLDWAARKFQARIGELMQQIETLQGEEARLIARLAEERTASATLYDRLQRTEHNLRVAGSERSDADSELRTLDATARELLDNARAQVETLQRTVDAERVAHALCSQGQQLLVVTLNEALSQVETLQGERDQLRNALEKLR